MCSAKRGCKSIRISNVPDRMQSPTKFDKFVISF